MICAQSSAHACSIVVPVRFPFAQPLVPASAVRNTDDLKQGSTLYRNYLATLPGAAAPSIIGDGANQYGLYRFRLNSVGVAQGVRTGIFWLPRSSFFLWQANFSIVDALSGVGGVTYRLQCGLTTGEFSALPAAGVGFSYTDTENNGRWLAWYINGAQIETFDTIADANLTRNAFRIYSPGATGPFVFLVNDRIVGAVTPQAAFSTPLRASLSAFKIAVAGQRDFTVDYNATYWARPDIP